MYRLQIWFNTTSYLRDIFYFVYLPPLPHSQFVCVGGFSILTLDPMLVLVQEKMFCHISLVMGYFSDLLKEYGCFLSIIQNLRFLRCYQKYFSPFYDTPHKNMIRCMKISGWDEYIKALIFCKKLIIYRVMGISSFLWSDKLPESPANLWI